MTILEDIQAHINTVSCALLQKCVGLPPQLSSKANDILSQFCEEGDVLVLYVWCDTANSTYKGAHAGGVAVLSLTLPALAGCPCIAFVKNNNVSLIGPTAAGAAGNGLHDQLQVLSLHSSPDVKTSLTVLPAAGAAEHGTEEEGSSEGSACASSASTSASSTDRTNMRATEDTGNPSSNSTNLSSTLSVLSLLHRYTKHVFQPVVQASVQRASSSNSTAASSSSSAEAVNAANSGNTEQLQSIEDMLTVHRRIGELEVAIGMYHFYATYFVCMTQHVVSDPSPPSTPPTTETCQRSAMIPNIRLAVPQAVADTYERHAHEERANALLLKEMLDSCASSSGSGSGNNDSSCTTVDALLTSLGLFTAVDADACDSGSSTAIANFVHKQLRRWPRQIQELTALIEVPPASNSIFQEVELWNALSRQCLHTQSQLEAPQCLLARLVLRRTNAASDSDRLLTESVLSLNASQKIAQESVSFLSNFPIHDMETATNLYPKLSMACNACLKHFSKLKTCAYDYSRAVKLLEMTSVALSVHITTLISEANIMMCPIAESQSVLKDALEVFATWESQITAQRFHLKDEAKARGQKSIPTRFEALDLLKARIEEVSSFCNEYDMFSAVCVKVLKGQGDKELKALRNAYAKVAAPGASSFKGVGKNLLDTSASGQAAWTAACKAYNAAADNLEARVIVILDERLSQKAQTVDEMFIEFSTFNALLYRPAVRDAVHSYRVALVKHVHADVMRLQEKFKLRYEDSNEKKLADLRDIPPLAGRVMWAKQIKTHLGTMVQRLGDVLGHEWEQDTEGKQLKGVCDELLNYLGTANLYNEWLSQQLNSTGISSSNVRYAHNKEFPLLVEVHPRTGKRYLKVNFESRHLVLYKEVLYLEQLLPTLSRSEGENMHKKVPQTIRALAQEAFSRYPVALKLQAALEAFATCQEGLAVESIMLLNSRVVDVREAVKEVFGGTKRSSFKWVKWSGTPSVEEWCSHLSQKVQSFKEGKSYIQQRLAHVSELLQLLSTCIYQHAAMFGAISQIQDIINDVQMRGYANISAWVKILDAQVEQIVMKRVTDVLQRWTASFDSLDVQGSASVPALQLPIFVHEITLTDQILQVEPPLDQARIYWLRNLHEQMEVALTLPRLISTRFQVFASASTADKKNYLDIMPRIGATCVISPVTALEKQLSLARMHTHEWLQYQTLWDVPVGALSVKIGSDLLKWSQLIQDIRQARTSINNDEKKVFGPIVINHRHVQQKINQKHNTWQQECQQLMSGHLNDAIHAAHADLVQCKQKLEAVVLEGMVSEVVAGVSFVTGVSKSIEASQRNVDLLVSCERVLQRQHYEFPATWKPVSNLVSALKDVCVILERRTLIIDAKLPILRGKIEEENANIENKVASLTKEWQSARPMDGEMHPPSALAALLSLEERMQTLVEEGQQISDAKDLLRINGTSSSSSKEKTAIASLQAIQTEAKGLHAAWFNVSEVHNRLTSIGAAGLQDVNAADVKVALEKELEFLRVLPAKVRVYECVSVVQEKIQCYLTYHPILKDIFTNALKERHWSELASSLQITVVKNVTLGQLWDADPILHRKAIASIVSKAQGELALEQFFQDIAEHWQSQQLSTVVRGDVSFVAGWDLVFTSLDDHLTDLASLKTSPFFASVSEFADLTQSWESKLTSLKSILSLWVEAQRRWIYLRGILRNQDLLAQLPIQAAKFRIIDQDFSVLVKRVSTKPVVTDLLLVNNLEKQLERSDSVMTQVQRALGDYLEAQRKVFPRFYFMNNDDLVEIIGSAREPSKVNMHLSKMFGGLSSLRISGAHADNAESLFADAMCSKEGEAVPLLQPVALTTSSSPKEWLVCLEEQMVSSLEGLLNAAVRAVPMSSIVSSAEDLTLTATQKQEQGSSASTMRAWIEQFPGQVVLLAAQIQWCQQIESCFQQSAQISSTMNQLQRQLDCMQVRLRALSEGALEDLSRLPIVRKKFEQLLTDAVHQRDVVRALIESGVAHQHDFGWLCRLRYYWNVPLQQQQQQQQLDGKVQVRMADASFFYGYEYLGIRDILVQTPLTDRCYLTLTQALHNRMGGNPFGPAGTGKTESVKMLGAQLGRLVLVFNCDSTFDYMAMGRIFAGLCHVGAWGCFDEFNRLEERILSAVSQQILSIQRGLLLKQNTIELLGAPVTLQPNVGIFVTLNPGYAGRSNLPDNLKQLFRGVAMAAPDSKLIAQVTLLSQGLLTAEELAGKIVLLFTLCDEQLSSQRHYDFGLRALKSVLLGAGELKRARMQEFGANDNVDVTIVEVERNVLVCSARENVLPKLVAEDAQLFESLLQAVFPTAITRIQTDELFNTTFSAVCAQEGLDSTDNNAAWVEKVHQLCNVVSMRHGVMLVGPALTGKTTAWRTLLAVLSKIDNTKGDVYVIDPKAMTKDALYGSLDPHTLEWKDGVFTKILRKISAAEEAYLSSANASTSGSSESKTSTASGSTDDIRRPRRSWIVFDGDCDPLWAESLNSVLDDNKLFTLPSGDRIKIPECVRILLEVDSLKHTTLATVSRCGMVWFPEGTLSSEILLKRQFLQFTGACTVVVIDTSDRVSNMARQQVCSLFSAALERYWLPSPAFVGAALVHSLACRSHVMTPHAGSLLATLTAILQHGMMLACEHVEAGEWVVSDADVAHAAIKSAVMECIEAYALRWLLYSVYWAFGSSLSDGDRNTLAGVIRSHADVRGISDLKQVSDGTIKLSDIYPVTEKNSWGSWAAKLKSSVAATAAGVALNDMVETVRTLKYVAIIKALLLSQRFFLLYGPPGGGKSMILKALLAQQSMQLYTLITLNFSSATTPELLHQFFASNHCEVVETAEGLVLRPNRRIYRSTEWLVLFCTELNLPVRDEYATQRIILFMRQLIEQQGYWDAKGRWIKLTFIHLCGSCHPSSDYGRVELPPRFLRSVSVLFIDYPTRSALEHIYCTYLHALLTSQPHISHLNGLAPMCSVAMVELYSLVVERFTADQNVHYVYSPRDLTNWLHAVQTAIQSQAGFYHSSGTSMSEVEFIRLWIHEGLRVFGDRLVRDADRAWCEASLESAIRDAFAVFQINPQGSNIELDLCLQKPLLFSAWLHSNHHSATTNALVHTYQSVDSRSFLRDYVLTRLKVFYEEELDVPLVIFDEALDHMLRIDKALKTPGTGHLLLIGESGVGKTVLTRFVAWMNELSIFAIKANTSYTLDKFCSDLRGLLYRVGVDGERICFILDESNVLSATFLEKITSLLSCGEVPGLFVGDERVQVLAAFKEAAKVRNNSTINSSSTNADSATGNSAVHSSNTDATDVDTADNILWHQFCLHVQHNLHIVLTMNPASAEFENRCITSPALLKHCHFDWFGTWSQAALAQVAHEFTLPVMSSSAGSSTVKYLPPLESGISQMGEDAVILSEVLDTLCCSFEQMTLKEAVVTALVSIHHTAKGVGSSSGSGGRDHYLSPRDFLDLIRHFLALEEEKRSLVEDQQTHLRKGLHKLNETQEQVGKMRAQMVEHEDTLQRKEVEANAKLVQMIDGQREAESSKTTAEALTVQLCEQNVIISERKEAAEKELSNAEPAVRGAKESVSNIRKAQLDEIRALTRPPEKIQLTLEMVAIMMGEHDLTWSELRKVIRRDDFISTVVNFDPMSLNAQTVSRVKSEYLHNPDRYMDYDSVDRASKACGPLFQWAQSQIFYAEILTRIQPLREEVAELTLASRELEKRQQNATTQVAELQIAISTYKSEYTSCVRETEAIRAELDLVQKKVRRAEALLGSLLQEQDRWQVASSCFDEQMTTLIGDALLGAAFLTYSGTFDHHGRKKLFSHWTSTLQILNISIQSTAAELDPVIYLSTPHQQMNWRNLGLPQDDLAMQNAILLKRFQRYPLIVDPSGQATLFINAQFAQEGRKIAEVSALDKTFLKTLSSCIRFGTVLIVQDAESVDSILHPVLNREYQRISGRILIRVGSEDVDYSPQFTLILVSRHPNPHFTPDLCSRVSIVNFGVTPASLEAQALGAILRAERPEVQERHTELLTLMAAQAAKLRDLEEMLLHKISQAHGTILDDDSVVMALESIKAEAADLSWEAAKTEAIMLEVRSSARVYEPLAAAMAAVYFSLEALGRVFPLYQFSLSFFLELLQQVLDRAPHTISSGADADAATDTDSTTSRLAQLSSVFYSTVCARVTTSLREADKLLLRVRLAQIAIQDTSSVSNSSASLQEQHFLWKDIREATPSSLAATIIDTDAGSASLIHKYQHIFGSKHAPLEPKCVEQILSLSKVPAFASLLDSFQNIANHGAWTQFLDAPCAELHAPLHLVVSATTETATISRSDSTDSSNAIRQAFLSALLVKAMRPDRLQHALESFSTAVFGADASAEWRNACASVDLVALMNQYSRSTTPVLISSSSGHDPSSRIEALASATASGAGTGTGTSRSSNSGTTVLLQVSMGSSEGFSEAERLLHQGAKHGQWVLLRNIHLCPGWLAHLEQSLHALQVTGSTHSSFRLFLTSTLASVEVLPVSLVRMSEIVVMESASGIKANLLRFLAGISHSRMHKASGHQARLYGMLGWVHAVIQERCRYLPLGWSKYYDFSEADAARGLDAIDSWVDSATSTPTASVSATANANATVDPKLLPWLALQAMLSNIYGGRIDRPGDLHVLHATICKVFRMESFASSAPLVADPCTGAVLLTLPKGLTSEEFEKWAHALPDMNPPTWLGLPLAAEQNVQVYAGRETLARLAVLQGNGDTDATVAAVSGDVSSGSAAPRAIMPNVSPAVGGAATKRVGEWLALLEPLLSALKEQAHARAAASAANTDAGNTAASATSGPSPAIHTIFRALTRELSAGTALLDTVVTHLQSVCNFDRVGHNVHRRNQVIKALYMNILQGSVPQQWSALLAPSFSSLQTAAEVVGGGGSLGGLQAWMTRLASLARHWTEHLVPCVNSVKNANGSGAGVDGEGGGAITASATATTTARLNVPIWLGALLHPTAFIIATRQYCAQINGWDIASLELWLHVDADAGAGAGSTTAVTGSDDGDGGGGSVNNGAVYILGLSIEGAEMAAGQVVLSDRQSTPLSNAYLYWQQKQHQQQGSNSSNGSGGASLNPITMQRGHAMPAVPMYRNAQRAETVGEVHMTFKLDTCSNADRLSFLQRNVCLLLETH